MGGRPAPHWLHHNCLLAEVLQPVQVRNTPCGERDVASGARSQNRAGPRAASQPVREAVEKRILRH
eukprot:11375177-Alexandrium_andersonii.AAC.1